MKKIVVGFILGVVTSLSFTANAVNSDIFTAQKASFEVFVDGKRFESENPPLVVEGRTYLPLKETGDALGVNVQWNNDLRRVEIEKDQEAEVTPEMPKQTKDSNKTTKSGEIFKEFKQKLGTTFVKEINGELYASPSSIGQEYISRQDESWYITLPGRKPVLVKMGSEPTENSIIDRGYLLVKLSSLGLEAEINGDTVILRYK
ncbi:MAG: stalk domain-containing protein [Candidatus Hydrothermia bacterium]